MNLSDALGSIAILLPGYLGAWLMSTIVGIRKREWSQTVLYSLIFSAFTYLLILRITPEINHIFPFNHLEMQKAINQVSNLGGKENSLTFNSAVKVAAFCLPISLLFGYVVGKTRTSESFRNLYSLVSGRTQNTDIWNDFHERYRVGPHTILLRNGDALLGRILFASDTLVGGDRGIIIEHPVYYKDPIASQLNGTKVEYINTPGNALVLYDQIAYIFDSRHPASILRAERRVKVGQMNKPMRKLFRRVRKLLSKRG